MKKVVVVAVATDAAFAKEFSELLAQTAVVRTMTWQITPKNDMDITTGYTCLSNLKMALTDGSIQAAANFRDAEVRILAALDQSAYDFLNDLEMATREGAFAGTTPIICRLDDAVVEYCRLRKINRLWVHHQGGGDSCAMMTRSLSKAHITPIGQPLQIDGELKTLLIDAALALRVNSPEASKIQTNLQRALEFHTQHCGAQGVLLDHWAWTCIKALPSGVGGPYLLSATVIFAEKLADVALSCG